MERQIVDATHHSLLWHVSHSAVNKIRYTHAHMCTPAPLPATRRDLCCGVHIIGIECLRLYMRVQHT